MAMYSGEKAFSINCFMFFRYLYGRICSSQVALVVKNSPANAGRCRRHEFNPWVKEIPWRRKWQPTPVLLPGKFHGWRSLVGSPLDCKESDMTEWLHGSLPLAAPGNSKSSQVGKTLFHYRKQ